MPIPHIEKRLVAIESAIAAYAPTCATCEDWPSFFVRFREEDGTITNNRADGWPAEEIPTCPGCGRTCAKVITIGCDPRGPA